MPLAPPRPWERLLLSGGPRPRRATASATWSPPSEGGEGGPPGPRGGGGEFGAPPAVGPQQWQKSTHPPGAPGGTREALWPFLEQKRTVEHGNPLPTEGNANLCPHAGSDPGAHSSQGVRRAHGCQLTGGPPRSACREGHPRHSDDTPPGWGTPSWAASRGEPPAEPEADRAAGGAATDCQSERRPLGSPTSRSQTVGTGVYWKHLLT